MPWFVDSENCVIKGTKESPGEKVKCHESSKAAVDHIKALYANMPEHKEIAGVVNFTEGSENRCLIVCTVDEIDRDGESFSTEAMDYAFEHAKKEGMPKFLSMPELRGIHIKGLHIGEITNLFRAGKYGVAEGRYFDTPIAQEFRKAVDRGTMKGSSLGFNAVEVTGRCRCGVRLLVGRLGLRAGYLCPSCSNIYSGRILKDVRFTKAEIFDVTLTDRPSVRSTNVVNLTYKETVMKRKEIKDRLKSAGFDEGVVDHYVDALSDEDCQRMKDDDGVEQKFKDDIAAIAKIAPPPDETGTGVMEIDAVLAVIKEEIAKAMPQEIELELPAIDAKLKEMDEKITEIVGYLKEMSKSDEDRLKEIAAQASPATGSRLRFRNGGGTPTPKQKEAKPGDIVIPDANGNTFASVTDFLTGQGGG